MRLKRGRGMGVGGNWREAAIRNEVVDATERLLTDRTFAELKVKEVCSEVGISKPTFYSRFKDKYAIVQWHFLDICERGFFEIGRTIGWDEGDLIMAEAICERRLLYMRAYQDSKNYQSISAFGHRVVRRSMLETIVDYRKVELTESLEFQVNYWANSTLITFTNWGKKGMPIPPDRFAHYLTSCAPHELYVLLRDPL